MSRRPYQQSKSLLPPAQDWKLGPRLKEQKPQGEEEEEALDQDAKMELAGPFKAPEDIAVGDRKHRAKDSKLKNPLKEGHGTR